jgi:hypothetical protein
LYSSPEEIKSRRRGWEENVARMEEKGNAYRLLVRETEGKRLLRRLKSRWRIILN